MHMNDMVRMILMAGCGAGSFAPCVIIMMAVAPRRRSWQVLMYGRLPHGMLPYSAQGHMSLPIGLYAIACGVVCFSTQRAMLLPVAYDAIDPKFMLIGRFVYKNLCCVHSFHVISLA